jgi:nitrogen fixation NifU-like protein
MRYSKKLLNYFHNTEHAGVLSIAEKDIFTAKIGHAENLEMLELYFKILNQKVVQARFKACGSPALIAAVEYICGWVEGKTLDEIKKLQHQDILTELGLTSLHLHTAAFILSAVFKIVQSEKL